MLHLKYDHVCLLHSPLSVPTLTFMTVILCQMKGTRTSVLAKVFAALVLSAHTSRVQLNVRVFLLTLSKCDLDGSWVCLVSSKYPIVPNVGRYLGVFLIQSCLPNAMLAGRTPGTKLAGRTPDTMLAGRTPDTMLAGYTPGTMLAGCTPDTMHPMRPCNKTSHEGKHCCAVSKECCFRIMSHWA